MGNELINTLLTFFQDNGHLAIFFSSMFPITELRGSVPFGILVLELGWVSVFLLSLLGNFLICIPVLYLLKYIDKAMRKNKHADRLIQAIFRRTRSKSKMILSYKYYGLMFFVAIPFPLTGAWTGCLASYLLDLDKRKSLLFIIAGLAISCTIMTLMTLFFDQMLVYTGYSR